jgi:hypothetical protein
MPYAFLRVDHYEPSPVAGCTEVFARARYRDPVTLAETTQEFRFPTLAEAQTNAQRYAEAYLPIINGVDLALQTAPQSRAISKVEFLSRFGDANMVAVLTAAKVDPLVEAWVFWFNAATEIQLDDGLKVREGIESLMAAGLIDADTLNRVFA